MDQHQAFKNMSAGVVGAVKIDAAHPTGRGVAVQPGEVVWLTHDEKVLTANAPRDPKDNPFLPQRYVRINNETGQPDEVEVTPLVPVSEARYVPHGDRFVPGVEDNDLVRVEGQKVEGQKGTREPGGGEGEQVQPPPTDVDGKPVPPAEEAPAVPPRAARAAAAAQADEKAGSEGSAPETGAAVKPSGSAPEGQFAKGEEVGTPSAPAAPAAPRAGREGSARG